MSDKINYSKTAKTTSELLQQLADRGMFIQNPSYAEAVLTRINYYRLSGYWFPFQNKFTKMEAIPADVGEEEKENLENKFTARVTFQNIIDIYRFDTKLRSLCFDALEKIEIAAGTLICEHMCNKYGGYWFENDENIQPKKKKTENKDDNIEFIFNGEILRKKLRKLLDDNRPTQCIKHFISKYSNEFPPYWILSQIITFGLLSQIYSSLKNEDRKEIAAKLGVPDTFLMEALHSLSYVRNICAHYGRLWNRHLVILPPDVAFKMKEAYQFRSKGKKKFFNVYYLISFFLMKIAPDSKWSYLVKKLIERYSEKTMVNRFKKESLISFDNMGFPEEWEDLPLFEKMLENK